MSEPDWKRLGKALSAGALFAEVCAQFSGKSIIRGEWEKAHVMLGALAAVVTYIADPDLGFQA